MSSWLWLLPVVAAFTGWALFALLQLWLFRPYQPKKIAGLKLWGLLPAKQKAVSEQVGILAASFLSIEEIEEKITHANNVKKIMPHAEEHIDHFLRVKLVKSMPVVGMFVGDKTINSLKALFMTELEELFPEIMKTYMGRLKEDFDIKKIVSGKIAGINGREIELAARKLLSKEFRVMRLSGALLGLLIGLIQLVLLQIIPR